jgi:calcium/calmodulin-dependent protein kinase I
VTRAHRDKLFHNNLSPDWILINPTSSKIMIYGFGNTVITKDVISYTNYTTLCSPPEAFQDVSTIKRDVWGIGSILYFILWGRPPFYGESTNEVKSNIEWDRLRIPTFLSHSVKDLLDKLLIKDQEQRMEIGEIIKHPWFTEPSDDMLYTTPDLRKFKAEIKYRSELFEFERRTKEIMI